MSLELHTDPWISKNQCLPPVCVDCSGIPCLAQLACSEGQGSVHKSLFELKRGARHFDKSKPRSESSMASKDSAAPVASNCKRLVTAFPVPTRFPSFLING